MTQATQGDCPNSPRSYSPTMQRDTFLAGEGDAWFWRHQAVLSGETAERKRMLDFLEPLLGAQPRVLEVGSSVGINLELLRRRRPEGEYFGIDPSSAAIMAGRRLFPGLDLSGGTADHLPFPDGKFNLLWFRFCLYLIDRALLFKVVAEADRVLADGGFIAIADFDPKIPRSRVYHQKDGLLSYKMDYANLFLANPAYVMVDKISYGAGSDTFERRPSERLGFCILNKNLQSAYLLEER